jgi:prepilin-type N-terminal cleavage/methylation domain-containing protein
MRPDGNPGFTIIELLVVVAVLAILLGVGFVNLPRDRFLVNQAVERFERDVERARFNALSHNTGITFKVTPEAGAYSAEPAATGTRRAAFEVNLEREGLGGVMIAPIDGADNGSCDGAPGSGVWHFDARGVGRQHGVTLVVFQHRSSGYAVEMCVNSYGRVQR